MSQIPLNDQPLGEIPKVPETTKSAIPFVLPSEPIISDLPEVMNEKESETKGLKISHDHTEAISVTDYDTGLQQAFEHRKHQKKRRKTTFGLARVAILTVICGAAATWYFNSSENQAKVAGAWESTKTLVSETKEQTDISNIIGTYDKALDKIEVRQDETNAATSALGGDSISVTTEDDANFRKLHQEMSGNDRTSQDRDIEMQNKFGKLADKIRAKTDTERPEKKLEPETSI